MRHLPVSSFISKSNQHGKHGKHITWQKGDASELDFPWGISDRKCHLQYLYTMVEPPTPNKLTNQWFNLDSFCDEQGQRRIFFVPYWEETKCENTMSSHVHLILSHLNLEFCIVNAGSQFCHDIFLVQLDPLSSSCQPPSCLEKTHLLNDSLNGGNSFLLWWNPTRWERIRDENPTFKAVVILFLQLSTCNLRVRPGVSRRAQFASREEHSLALQKAIKILAQLCNSARISWTLLAPSMKPAAVSLKKPWRFLECGTKMTKHSWCCSAAFIHKVVSQLVYLERAMFRAEVANPALCNSMCKGSKCQPTFS